MITSLRSCQIRVFTQVTIRMDTDQLMTEMKRCKNFLGVFCADEIPVPKSLPVGMILNLDKCSQDGSHWISLWINSNKTGEYFDSFGTPPMIKSIKSYIEMTCPLGILYNKAPLQHPDSIACGRYAIFFIKHKILGYSFDYIINHFTKLKNY